MKKLRGLRLGRKLVRLYRRLLCRRRRPRRAVYTRLGAASSSLPPAADLSSALSASTTYHKLPTVTGKLFGWGRKLCRRPFPIGGWFLRHLNPTGGGRRGFDRLGAGSLTREKMLPFTNHRPSQKHQYNHEPCQPPKGHLVVYVGKGGSEGGPPPHRVVVPVIYFNHPLFGELLREAEQEYGFNHPGGITIPCPISDFENVRDRVAASDLSVRTASGRSWRWN